ncbi:hypothetical protein BH11ARM2_BH11ARM2_02730 [soil metagenome]
MTIDQNPTPTALDDAPQGTAEIPASDTTETSAPAATTPDTDPTGDAAPSTDTSPIEPTAALALDPEAPVAPEPEEAPVVPVQAEVPTPAPAEPAPAPTVAAAPAVETADDADLFEKYMQGGFGDVEAGETSFERPQKGKRYEATIIQVEDDKVFVSLGAGKAEGIVPLSELSEENLTTAKGHFNTGDKINVIVLRTEGADGNPIVSKKRADFEEVWDRIEAAHRDGTSISAPVVDRVKGGLVVDIGVRGFVPATHVGSGKLRNIEKYVGETLDLKVIEIDRDRKKVVLSNREAEEQRRTSAKDEIFNNVKPGDILDGTVRRLTDYGAFVDLGGVDGLLHISEMSWARINHPKEIFKEGQKIKVMVLRLDKDNGKISLGHRQVLPDPWKEIGDKYRNGQKLMVNVTRLVQSGAFIRLPEGAEAFMPVSEMSPRRIKRPQDVVEEGQEVECQVIDLRPEERRMVLSMKAVGGGMELRPGVTEAPADFRPDRRSGPGGGRGRDGGFEEFGGARRGIATGGATIGERLGALKGLLKEKESETQGGD